MHNSIKSTTFSFLAKYDMKQISPPIAEHYDWWRKQIGEGEPYKGTNILGIHDVLRAHFLIVDFFASRLHENPVGLIGPRDLGLLHSAVLRQLVSYGGRDKWKEDIEIIATLFYGLIKNHPFHDGNKRTALLCALYHLQQCHRTPIAPQKDLERVTLYVADNLLDKYPRYRDFQKRWKADADVLFLAHWFKKNTRLIDKRF